MMLHSLAITSVDVLLQTLNVELAKKIYISDFIRAIPDSIDGQEMMLQV